MGKKVQSDICLEQKEEILCFLHSELRSQVMAGFESLSPQ